MNHPPPRFTNDGFFMTAFWQLMSFVMMILLIWVDEVLDLSNLWFGMRPDHPNFFKGCALTIGILCIAIITIGHTYLQQKRILKGLIIICSQCRKMRIDENVWKHLDQYVADHSKSQISHGLCPQCYEMAKQEIDGYANNPH
jgi:hypothetical protein